MELAIGNRVVVRTEAGDLSGIIQSVGQHSIRILDCDGDVTSIDSSLPIQNLDDKPGKPIAGKSQPEEWATFAYDYRGELLEVVYTSSRKNAVRALASYGGAHRGMIYNEHGDREYLDRSQAIREVEQVRHYPTVCDVRPTYNALKVRSPRSWYGSLNK